MYTRAVSVYRHIFSCVQQAVHMIHSWCVTLTWKIYHRICQHLFGTEFGIMVWPWIYQRKKKKYQEFCISSDLHQTNHLFENLFRTKLRQWYAFALVQLVRLEKATRCLFIANDIYNLKIFGDMYMRFHRIFQYCNMMDARCKHSNGKYFICNIWCITINWIEHD